MTASMCDMTSRLNESAKARKTDTAFRGGTTAVTRGLFRGNAAQRFTPDRPHPTRCRPSDEHEHCDRLVRGTGMLSISPGRPTCCSPHPVLPSGSGPRCPLPGDQPGLYPAVVCGRFLAHGARHRTTSRGGVAESRACWSCCILPFASSAALLRDGANRHALRFRTMIVELLNAKYLLIPLVMFSQF